MIYSTFMYTSEAGEKDEGEEECKSIYYYEK